MEWGAAYLSAWNAHDVEQVVAKFADDGDYLDVPRNSSWQGHAGIREMFHITSAHLPDYAFEYRGGFRDGERYAIEWVMSGTNSGNAIRFNGVSVGRVDDQNRIVEHRDYYSIEAAPEHNGT
jgi:hypothetical protein